MNEPTAHTRSPKQYRIGAAIFFFLSGIGYSTWASRIPSIKAQLHLNDAQLGTALFALPVGLMLTMPFTTWLLSRYSSRAIILIGSCFLSFILALIGFADSYWQLVVLLLFFGSARNLIALSVNTQGVAVQALYPKSIMASFHGIWSLACFTAAGISVLMVSFNVAPAWQFTAIGITLVIFSLYFIKDTLHQQPVKHASGKIYSLPDKYLLKFALICFACMACENTMYDWGVLYFQKEVTPDKTIAAASLTIYLIAMTTGRFVGDKIVNRLGIKTVLKFSGIFILCGLSLAVALPYTITASLGFILVGFGVSCVVPMVFSLAGKSKNMSSSSALASISTVGYFGFVLVPPFVGYVAHAASLRLSFGIIALFGGLIIYLVSKINDTTEPVDHPMEDIFENDPMP